MNLRVGIEFEGFFTKKYADEIDNLGEEYPKLFNETCNDGSLSTREKAMTSREIVTAILERGQVHRIVDIIRRTVQDGNRLKNYMVNKTCGLHIHFSLKCSGRNNDFHGAPSLRFFEKIRNSFFEKLGDRRIPTNVAESILSHYFRGYAQRVTTSLLNNQKKYTEFYYSPSGGIEWRSVNILGCETYAQIETVIYTAMDSIEAAFLEEFQKSEPFLHAHICRCESVTPDNTRDAITYTLENQEPKKQEILLNLIATEE